MSRDPLGETGGANILGFAGNDPVNHVDPLGLVILCHCPEDYFSSFGLTKGKDYTQPSKDYYVALPGAFNPGADTEGQIVWRMLSTRHPFKARGKVGRCSPTASAEVQNSI